MPLSSVTLQSIGWDQDEVGNPECPTSVTGLTGLKHQCLLVKMCLPEKPKFSEFIFASFLPRDPGRLLEYSLGSGPPIWAAGDTHTQAGV